SARNCRSTLLRKAFSPATSAARRNRPKRRASLSRSSGGCHEIYPRRTAAGGALIWRADRSLREAQAHLATAQGERRAANERLARISEEEREVKEKIDVYQRLKGLNI